MTHDPLIGRQLANFQIEHLLGQGGMALVYYGLDIKLQRPVAVKVMHPRYQGNLVYTERFLREARTVAAWHHEHIVQIYYADEIDGLAYFVMEYIGGQDLATLLARHVEAGTLLPQLEILRLGRAIARALDYAHEKGVVHRDVKPSNVFISDDARVVLGDFGMALELTQEPPVEGFGTAHYIAPEQALRAADAVPSSDLYSLGVMLYEMLTGARPFDDPSASSVAIQHMTMPPPSPCSLNPALGLEVEHVLLKALDKSPAKRYPSGVALLDALEQALSAQRDPDRPGDVELAALGLSDQQGGEPWVLEEPALYPELSPSPAEPSAGSPEVWDASRSATPGVAASSPLEQLLSGAPPAEPSVEDPRGGEPGLSVAAEPGHDLSTLAAALASASVAPAPSSPVSWRREPEPYGLAGSDLLSGDTASASWQPAPSAAPPSHTSSWPLSRRYLLAVGALLLLLAAGVLGLFNRAPGGGALVPSPTQGSAPSAELPAAQLTSQAVSGTSGRRALLVYDQHSLYLINLSDEPLDNLAALRFERLEDSGATSEQFSGSQWPYQTIKQGRCSRLQLLGQPVLDLPADCAREESSIERNSGASGIDFWTPRAGSRAFRVIWQEQELARCPIAAGRCALALP